MSRAIRRRPIPEYPFEAVQAGIAGRVEVIVSVDREGRVDKVCVTRGPAVLGEAAERAVRGWQFKRHFGTSLPAGPRDRRLGGVVFEFVLPRHPGDAGLVRTEVLEAPADRSSRTYGSNHGGRA